MVCSPDLNPIENLCAIMARVYNNGRHFWMDGWLEKGNKAVWKLLGLSF